MDDINKKLRLVTVPLSSIGIVFNFLLLVFAFRHKIASRSATALVRSQVVFDLLVLSTNIAFVQLQLIPQPAQSDSVDAGWYLFCILGSESTMIFWYMINCSIYNTLAFTVERCLCICCNFWWQTHKRAMLKLFYSATLLISFVAYVPLNLLSVWPQQADGIPEAPNETSVITTVVCDSRDRVPEAVLRALGVASTSVTVLLPTLCMLICYAVIIFHLRRSAKLSASSSKSEAASRRFTITVGLTVVAFMACNLPDTVIYMAWIHGHVFHVLPLVVRVFVFPFLSAGNSLVNPLIYLIFHRQFTRFVFCRRAELSRGSGSKSAAATSSRSRGTRRCDERSVEN